MAAPQAEDVTRFLHGKDPSDRPGEESYPLLCHLLDTLVVADILWSTRVRRGLRERVATARVEDGELGADRAHAALLYAAALHDIGKANPFFQYQERVTKGTEWAPSLSAALGLGGTPRILQEQLRSHSGHALRRHEFVSHRAVSGTWAAPRDSVAGADWVGVVAGGHHGFWRPMAADDAEVGDMLLEGGWGERQDSLITLVDRVIEQITGVKRDEIPSLKGRDAAIVAVLLTGLLIEADWIASDDEQVEVGKRAFLSGLDPHVSVAVAVGWVDARRPVLQAHVDESLGQPLDVERDVLTDLIMGGYEPRPLQRQAAELSPAGDDAGLWIAMYPTGDGKTEAAGLRHALDASEGLVFGLPTRATTDAMEARVAQWYESLGVPVIKSHQFAQLGGRRPHDSDDEPDPQGAGCGSASWYTTALRKLASPNVVATCDQVLAGALKNRHIAMRLFNLANHHVVLDEVHTYDTYQTELLVELLHWWGATQTRVTLLSATLPREHMVRMASAYRAGAGVTAAPEDVPETAYPGSLFVPASPDRSVVALDPPEGSARTLPPVTLDLAFTRTRDERVTAHVDWVAATVAEHPNSPIAVVSNTVADCVAVATRLANDPAVTRTHEVLCLHSSMVAIHRTTRERELLAAIGKEAHAAGFDYRDVARRPAIVVGTQVIQASLDIDVDFLATDLAPAPDLIQRLGRQWRFVTDASNVSEERQRRTGGVSRVCRLVSVTEDDNATVSNSVPYLVSTLQNTLTWLRQRPAPVLDVVGDSQSWVDQAYDRRLMADLATEEPAKLFAHDRIAEDALHVIEAAKSKAVIAPRKGGKGLLRESGGWGSSRTATWADLAELTEWNVDEARMRTRFIDHESLSLILFDEDGLIGPLGQDLTGVEVRIPAIPVGVEELPPDQASEALNLLVRVTLSATVLGMVEEAARATLNKGVSWTSADWKPISRVLSSSLPVDIKYLPNATYSALTGLTFSKERA